MATLTIKNLKLNLILGTQTSERLKRQTILLTITIDYNANQATKTDKITDALDYYALIQTIQEQTKDTKFQLIEKLTDFVAKLILKNTLVKSVAVEILKRPEILKEITESIVFSTTHSKKEKLKK